MKKLAAAVCCSTIFLILFLYQIHQHQNYVYTVTGETNRTRSIRKIKIILTWTEFFNEKDWLPQNLSELNCRVSDCAVTSDRKLLKDSAAVVLHWRDVNLQDLPESDGDQVWILYNKESPMHTPRNVLTTLSGRLNWTVTYRRDSDFFSPYGRIVSGKESAVGDKSASVAWLVSNCHTASKREDYVQELSNFVQVDVYGKCGQKYCPHLSASECYHKLASRYRFYLSFENSICQDYVTEKLFNALKSGMVPVVFGGADYTRILPPHSYIDTRDFASPRDLAEYLRNLTLDHQEYSTYFKWRESFRVDLVPYRWLCDVCEKLHQNVVANGKNLENLERWWYDQAQCSVWKSGGFTSL